MAKFYVTEFTGAGRYYGSAIPVGYAGKWTENAGSPVGIGSGASLSSTFNATTNLIRLETDAICSFLIGSSTGTTVTASNARMAANTVEYFEVPPGTTFVVQVITNI